MNLKGAGKSHSAPLATAGYYSLLVPLCRGPSGQAVLSASKRASARRRRWHQGAGRSGRRALLPFPTRAARTLPPLVCVAFRGRGPSAAHSEGRRPGRGSPRASPGPGPRSPDEAGLGTGDRLLRHLRLLGLEPDWWLPKQGHSEADPAPASRNRLHAASHSMLLAQEPRNGKRAEEMRGNLAPSRLTELGIA